MRQMLQDSLLKAQIEDTQSQSRLREAQAKTPKRYTVKTKSGEQGIVEIGPDGTAHLVFGDEAAKPPAISDTEWKQWVRRHPEFADTPAAARQKVIESYSGAAARAETKGAKTPTPQVLQKRQAVRRLSDLADELDQLEKAKDNAVTPSLLASGAGALTAIPGIGKGLGKAGVDRFRQSQLTPHQAAYERAKKEFGEAYLQANPGSRAMAQQELARGTFAPAEGTTSAAYPTYQQARRAAIKRLQTGLGDEEPDISPSAVTADPAAATRKSTFADLAKKYGVTGNP